MKLLKLLLLLVLCSQSVLAGQKLSVIRQPLINQPVILLPGSQFEIICQAGSGTEDWTVTLSAAYFQKNLPVSTSYNSSASLWTLTATIPSNTPFELYNLHVEASGGLRDTSPNSVRVIKEFRDSYYLIHMPDAHLPSCSWVGYYDDENTVPELEQLISEFNIINPEFILQTGDLVDNGQNENGFQIAKDILTSLKAPIFVTGGNHDLWYDGHNNWHEYFGLQMNYSFNYGGHHYSSMEMYDIPSVTFTASQMEWLQNDLSTSLARNDPMRVLFYHYDESHQIDDEFVDNHAIDLILYGHTHINGVNYLGTRGALNINTSYTMDDNGEYRLIKITGDEITSHPLLKFKNIDLRFSPANDGTNWIVNAYITNNTSARFENGLVKFIVPEDPSGYTIAGGTLQQVVQLENGKLLYYAHVDIMPNSSQTVTIQSQNPPSNWPPMISSYSPQNDTTITGGSGLNFIVNVEDNNGDAVSHSWYKNGKRIDGAQSHQYNFMTDETYEGVDTIRAEVYDGAYRDNVQWVITTQKFSGNPRVVSDIGNFFAFNEPATIVWDEPIPISAQLEYGTSPGDYSLGSIPETGANEVTFTPEDYGMALGRYFCRISDGLYSSREFYIVVESPVAPQMLSPVGNIQSLSPMFSWEKVVGVPYYWVMVSDQEVIVGENPVTGELMVEGANPIWAVLTSDNEVAYGVADPSGNFTSAPPPLIPGASYWWVVLNAYGNTPELTSPVIAGISEFKINLAPPEIYAPALLSPANDATLSAESISFEWEKVDGAVSYHVYPFKIERESDMETAVPMWQNIIATTNTYFDYPAYQRFVKGRYRWKIGAVDQNGLEVHSETRDFFYETANAVISIHTLDNGGTPRDVNDDMMLPRTKVEFESIDGIFTGIPLSTDFHGNRENINISPGTYIFEASKDLYETVTDTFTFEEDQSYHLHFRLSPGPGRLTGTVVSGENIPVQNATVKVVHSLHPNIQKQSSTDANGNFSLSLMGGAWQVSAEKDGYRTSNAVSLSLTAGETAVLPKDLVLFKNTNTISGTVVNPNNQPVFGAIITLNKNELEHTTTTDANGSFSVAVESGYWRLRVSKQGFISPPVTGMNVSGGVLYEVKPDPILQPNAAILSGYVSDGTTTLDSVLIKAIPTTGSIVTTFTDKYGYFSMNLAPGTYTVIPQKKGYYTNQENQITLMAGETVSGFNLLLLEITAIISGKTTINGSTPLEGVKITAGQLETYTSSSGTYSLELTRGNYSVSASKDGYFSSPAQSISVNDGQNVEAVDFVLTPNASVFKGRVTSTGGPVYRARVTATRYNSITAFTDENGYFTLNVEAGTWDIHAEKENFLDGSKKDITIGAGQTFTGLNFYLPKNETTITGTVTSAATSAPIRNVIIRITETGDESQTKNDGSFIYNIDPGSYTFTATKDGFVADQKSANASQANQTYVVDFNLTPAECHISGKISDENDSPLPDALFFEQADESIHTRTNSNGEYDIHLPAGNYTFDASKPGYINSTGPLAAILSPGESKADLDFSFTSNFAGLSGLVTDSLTIAPLINAFIAATGPDDMTASVYSSVSGEYSFVDEAERTFLPEGMYMLEISKSGFARKQLRDIQLAGSAATTRNIQLVSFSSAIEGKVVSGSDDISGATINAIHSESGESFSVVSGSDGVFSIHSIPVGNYYVNAYKSGFTSMEDTLINAGSTDVIFELLPNLGRIGGCVLDAETGDPLTGVYFYATDDHGHFGSASSNANGNFALENLATLHNYTISISKYGYERETLNGISPLTHDEITIEMQKILGAISGAVRDNNGANVGDVVLKLTRGNDTVDYDTTSVAGNFHFESLPVGTYYLYAQKVGFLSQPQYQSVSITQPGEIPNIDFLMDEAMAASISIRGSKSISNAGQSQFSFDALTSDGRTAVIEPLWSLSPAHAADSLTRSGLFDPRDDFIGPVTLSVVDNLSKVQGMLDISVYQLIGKTSAATTLHFSDDVQVTVPENSVDGDVQIGMKLPRIADSRRLTEKYEINGDVYEFTPSSIIFKNQLSLTLPVPSAESNYSFGRWDQENLSWVVAHNATLNGQSMSFTTNQLGRFAILSASKPLAIENIRFEPNPFSPNAGPLNMIFDLSSSETPRPFVTIKIYNMAGDLVRNLLENRAIAKGADKSVAWDGKTDSGKTALNGRYVVHFQVKDNSGKKQKLKTVVLIK